MPLFIKNNLVFIHIPKTGGTSIVRTMEQELDDKPLYYNETVFAEEKHSPQHSTYLELKQRNLLPAGFQIISVVRNPLDRFLSEYNWRVDNEGDKNGIDDFAYDFFENPGRTGTWDNHEKSQLHYLKGGLDMIEVIKFETLPEYFYSKFSVQLRKENVSNTSAELTDYTHKMIIEYWLEDFICFGYDRTFPTVINEHTEN